MLINADGDIVCLRGFGKKLSKRTILKMAIDLGQDLLSATHRDVIEQTEDGLDPPQNIVRRSWNCIIIISQLHTISTGGEHQISSNDSKALSSPTDTRNLLSEPTALLAGE